MVAAVFLLDYWDQVRPHLSTLGLIATWVGIVLVWWRRRSEWLRKSFLNQVNFSLNYVEDGKLCIRTLLETSASQVWLNSYGIGKVFKAAARTRPDQPFIILDDAEDMAFVKRAVLNVLSEKFAEMFVAQSMGLPVKLARYTFAITFENFPDMRTRKFRVLLVKTETLEKVFAPAEVEAGKITDESWPRTGPSGKEADLKVDEARHRDRLSVLRAIRDIHLGVRKPPVPILGELELGVLA